MILHDNIRLKLDGFYKSNRIPHLLFHGSSGTGKRTLIYEFVNKIYGGDKHKLKTNVMFVNCAHGKGIKFIRDELKFFAKTNIQGTQGVTFKTIVLFNADSLTIDAQSALRRCIELFSYNTRFFIVVENKHKLLNPILSRFCEIYVPEYIDAGGKILNLHQYNLMQKYGGHDDGEVKQWFDSKILPLLNGDGNKDPSIMVNIASDTYEAGFSCLDLMDWYKGLGTIDPHQKSKWLIHFQKIKGEYRCEKLLILAILDKIIIVE
jgi:hypothetical protein